MNKRKSRIAVLVMAGAFLLVLSTVLGACTVPVAKQELYVSAAISLKDALTEIAADFENKHPGTKVFYNFAASGQLAQQISQGAPADIFIAASKAEIDALASRKLIESSSIHDCAQNELVLIAPAGKTFSALGDLLSVERLAIGNPKTVPAGSYAVNALEAEKIYGKLASENKLVLAEDARQILEYVESGEVDAGLVYATDARLAKKSQVQLKVPKAQSGAIVYEAAVLTNSTHKVLANEFLGFILGPFSKKVFLSRGFAR
ncbi:MAG: molybdate ABC transporter substrate-binding protein [Candidatus Obscuribacterales bacterium]|nr:molybdate ABC transporter substrate-binding protein [Candidatus Obscuribacterales bacterium]